MIANYLPEVLTDTTSSISEMSLDDRYKDILNKLKVINISRKRARKYQVFCPAHDDQTGCLEIKKGANSISITCSDGCTLEQICKSLKISSDSLQNIPKVEVISPAKLKAQSHNNWVDPRFNADELPKTLQNFVDDCSSISNAPKIVSAISMLSVLSSYCQHRVVCPDYFETLTPNIWSLTIAPSGGFKSTGIRNGSCVLNDLEHEFSEAGEHNKLRRLQGRYTLQSLSGELAKRENGGIWILPEFNSWLANNNATWNEGVKSELTSIYDGDSLKQVSRSHGDESIARPYITLNGVSTLEFLKGLITKDDLATGFLARFLVFNPHDRGGTKPPALPKYADKINHYSWSSYKELKSLCKGLFDYPMIDYHQLHSKELQFQKPIQFHCLQMSSKVEQLHNTFYDRIYEVTDNAPMEIRSFLESFRKRWCPTMLKLAMLNQQIIKPYSSEFSESSLRGSFSIVWYAIQSTIQLLSREFGASPVQQKQSKVLSYIANRDGKVSYRKLNQSRILDGGNRDYDYVLESLVAQGRVHWLNKDQPSKATIELC